jgi:hypothetical protein
MTFSTILTAAQIEAYFANIAALDLRFANEARKFWSAQTVNQLKALRHQAWNSNDRDQYVLAGSFLKEMGA